MKHKVHNVDSRVAENITFNTNSLRIKTTTTAHLLPSKKYGTEAQHMASQLAV